MLGNTQVNVYGNIYDKISAGESHSGQKVESS